MVTFRAIGSENTLTTAVGGPNAGREIDWGGWTRTTNFPVNSRAVCQLTYTPKARQSNLIRGGRG